MSDLIRREDVMEAVQKKLNEWLIPNNNVVCRSVRGVIMDIPSADAVERCEYDILQQALEEANEALRGEARRGRNGTWIPVDSFTVFGGDEVTWMAHGNPIALHYCSVCGNDAYADEEGKDILSDFCPHCGADMRGDQNDQR